MPFNGLYCPSLMVCMRGNANVLGEGSLTLSMLHLRSMCHCEWTVIEYLNRWKRIFALYEWTVEPHCPCAATIVQLF